MARIEVRESKIKSESIEHYRERSCDRWQWIEIVIVAEILILAGNKYQY